MGCILAETVPGYVPGRDHVSVFRARGSLSLQLCRSSCEADLVGLEAHTGELQGDGILPTSGTVTPQTHFSDQSGPDDKSSICTN